MSDTVSSSFVGALEANQNINFGMVFGCVAIYIVLFWFAISVWVYTDAKKRYHNTKTAFFIALAVFILLVPALVMYLAVRPPMIFGEHEYPLAPGAALWADDIDTGVNIPVVNFVGDKGVRMTLELNIHPKPLENQNPNPHDMKVDVSWQSTNPDMQKGELPKELQIQTPNQMNSGESRFGKIRTAIGEKFRNMKARFAKKKPKDTPSDDKKTQPVAVDTTVKPSDQTVAVVAAQPDTAPQTNKADESAQNNQSTNSTNGGSSTPNNT